MSTTPTPADRARALENFGNTHGADLKHLEQAFADVRAEGFAAGRDDYRAAVLSATVRTLDEMRTAVVTLEHLGDLR